jgi:two-component system, chemotaxis family, chemotaxis protein CheY
MKFLIVDDSGIIRRILKNTISKYSPGAEMYEAENGEEAIKQMEAIKDIDIMFLDWNMPIMTGDQVVNIVRGRKDWNKTRIVMATTEGGKAQVLAMMKKGVNGYIVKPFQEQAIAKTLEQLSSRINRNIA